MQIHTHGSGQKSAVCRLFCQVAQPQSHGILLTVPAYENVLTGSSGFCSLLKDSSWLERSVSEALMLGFLIHLVGLRV